MSTQHDLSIVQKFLKGLAKNNNREWFEKNKPKYLEAKAVFDDFLANLLDEMTKFDESLTGLDPKKLSFRIYRDVRFSKDKRPYKTNFGASISPAGKGIGKPGYYLHIEPGNKNFLAAGLYMPDAESLSKVRQEIDYNGEVLDRIMRDKKFKKYYGDFWDEDKLKRAPKGYDEVHPRIEWIKLKSFIVTHDVKDSDVADKKYFKLVVDSFKSVKPFNDFFKEAVA